MIFPKRFTKCFRRKHAGKTFENRKQSPISQPLKQDRPQSDNWFNQKNEKSPKPVNRRKWQRLQRIQSPIPTINPQLISLPYTSKFFTFFAFVWMNFLRGATSEPIKTSNTSLAFSASSTVTSFIKRASGSIVVSQS